MWARFFLFALWLFSLYKEKHRASHSFYRYFTKKVTRYRAFHDYADYRASILNARYQRESAITVQEATYEPPLLCLFLL